MKTKTKTPDPIRAAATLLDRLCRERDVYLERASRHKEIADRLKLAGYGGSLGYKLAEQAFQDTVAWAYALQPQIDQATTELENAINAAGWGS